MAYYSSKKEKKYCGPAMSKHCVGACLQAHDQDLENFLEANLFIMVGLECDVAGELTTSDKCGMQRDATGERTKTFCNLTS